MTEAHDTKRSLIRPLEVAAGALAAVTGGFVGSRLGVTGTAIGAGIVSVISSIGAVVYEYSLERTSRSVLSRLPASRRLPGWQTARAQGSDGAGLPRQPPQPTRTPIRLPGTTRRRAALVIGLPTSLFALALAVVTGVEVLRGGPLSGGDSGTTVGSLFGQPTTAPATAGDPGQAHRTPAPAPPPTGDQSPPSTTTTTTTGLEPTTTGTSTPTSIASPTATAGGAATTPSAPPAVMGTPPCSQPPAPPAITDQR